ncbi:hypothetical protein niasHT_033657 [Heterodera trifolii]|uniref:E2 ubiquitin-conjugating enzyme n=1 Tax=Heterodera trifolii TaxID=157864 RepID=A0ABD2I9V3_9BILA
MIPNLPGFDPFKRSELFAFIIIIPPLYNNNNTSKATSSPFLIVRPSFTSIRSPFFAMTRRRIKKELAELEQEPITGYTAAPMDDGSDLYHWKATIEGPPESPYEGGTFHLDIVLRRDYPCTPPIVKFVTDVYHPNVGERGDICLDILKQMWAPALTIQKMLLSITSFLCEPNPNCALRQDIATMYRDNREEYNRNAREWTKKYATV